MLIYQFQYNNINACHCYKQLGTTTTTPPPLSSGASEEGEAPKGKKGMMDIGNKLIAQAMPDQTKESKEFSNYVKSKMPAGLRNADNIALLSRELLKNGYDKDTIIRIKIIKQGGACFVKIRLNYETYKGGYVSVNQAFEKALEKIKPNKLKKLDKKESNKLKKLSHYVKGKMPDEMKKDTDNIALLSRKLLDKGYDKDTIIRIKIIKQGGACFVKIKLNTKTYKGGHVSVNEAFGQALKKIV